MLPERRKPPLGRHNRGSRRLRLRDYLGLRELPRWWTIQRGALLQVAEIGRRLDILKEPPLGVELLDRSLGREVDHGVAIGEALGVAEDIVVEPQGLVRPGLRGRHRREGELDLDRPRAAGVAGRCAPADLAAGRHPRVVVEDDEVVEAEDVEPVLAAMPDEATAVE